MFDLPDSCLIEQYYFCVFMPLRCIKWMNKRFHSTQIQNKIKKGWWILWKYYTLKRFFILIIFPCGLLFHSFMPLFMPFITLRKKKLIIIIWKTKNIHRHFMLFIQEQSKVHSFGHKMIMFLKYYSSVEVFLVEFIERIF